MGRLASALVKTDRTAGVLKFSIAISSDSGIIDPYKQTNKERDMTNKMTVADLIAILSKVDPTLPVKMSMNMEYESYVDANMVGVRDYDNGPRLYISDTLDY